MKEDREIVPLRTILQNCLNHIENLESNRSICDNYEKEFQDLKQFSETLKVRKEFACTEGEKEVNRKKNRYKDILPFNVSRVILSKYAGIPGSDYINANFIKGASGSPAYIASQGPLPNTVNDFWRMVVECEVQVIVMACNAEEAGKHKCENYWVEKEGEEKRFGMVEICLVKASTVCPDFLVRTMRLKYTNDKSMTEERTICQFHYSAWPDHGVPPLVRPLLDMVRLVRDTQASETLPVLVHCSAGCGRTGTICAIDFVWGLLRAGFLELKSRVKELERYVDLPHLPYRLNVSPTSAVDIFSRTDSFTRDFNSKNLNKLTEEFSLFNLVKDMRKQRVAMVQTKEQYILVHQAVRELFKEQLQVIESHPYENIDVNGIPLIKDFEEPLYDTIGPCKNNCEEKHDENKVVKNEQEKKDIPNYTSNKPDTAPPLPKKKRPNIPFSKQEKEIENLTEKNRCSVVEKEKEILDVSPSNSLLSKPRIAKLKALFERSPTNRERNAVKHRGSQTVSRSHSLGAIRKPLFSEALDNMSEKRKPLNPTAQPIPDGGKLKVPKLSLSTTTVISKPVPLIKRSKSLKTISQPQQLTTFADISSSNFDALRDNHIKLRVVNKSSAKGNVSRKKPETISKATFKKSVTSQDLQKAQLPNELYKRRRSLESLIGDEPPPITWPNTVMFAPIVPNNSNLKISSKSSSEILSPQSVQSSKCAQGVKDFPTESMKQQFQNLSIDAQKKMNSLASGIGIRERRNSFRQAISKDDSQKQNRVYEYIWLDPKKARQKLESKTIQVSPNQKLFTENLTVRTQNGEILHPPTDQTDGVAARKEEITPYHQVASKVESSSQKSKSSPLHRAKTQLVKQNSEAQHPKFPQRPHELVRTLSSHAIQDKNSVFSVLRPNDYSRRIMDSKNLFLHRLNLEIQEGKGVRKPLSKDDGSKSDLIPSRRGGIEHSGSCDSIVALGARYGDKEDDSKWKEVSVVRMAPEGGDASWNFGRPYLEEKTGKPSCARPNPNFLGIHPFGNESHKAYEPAKTFRDAQSSGDVRKIVHRKPSSATKSLNFQGATNESLPNRNFEEPAKDPYSDLERKVHRTWTSPTAPTDKALMQPSVHRGEGYPKAYEPHGPIGRQPGGYASKSVPNRKPQPVEARKNFFSGTNSVSSHSSGDLSHSDQHSQKSDSPRIIESHDVEGIPKPEIMRLKSTQLKDKRWMDDCSRHGSESSSSSSARELASVLPPKPLEEVYNYGIVASVKLRPKPSHSRDDFVLGEPVVPPRVKRHASVKLPRQSATEPNVTHLSAWTSPEKKKLDVNNWNDALGVDLDAVAASMQRQKAESAGGSSEATQSNNVYNTPAAPQFPFKKQQHYL